jgi:hypothetical protein
VKFRGAGKTRRWQSAIAVVAALSLFAAITTGWASRASALAGTAPPQPAASAQAAPHVGAASHVAHGFSSSPSPRHQKPAKNASMTPNRRPTWNRMTAQSFKSPLPPSFAASGFAPGGAQPGAPPAIRADHDILTQLCVARR